MARKGHKVKGSKVMRRSAHHKATGNMFGNEPEQKPVKPHVDCVTWAREPQARWVERSNPKSLEVPALSPTTRRDGAWCPNVGLKA